MESNVTMPSVQNGRNVGRRAAAGGAWLLGARLAQQGVLLIQVAVLARLLDPKAFGLVGLPTWRRSDRRLGLHGL